MRNYFAHSVVMASIGVAVWCFTLAAGQQPPANPSKAGAKAPARPTPRLADGHPDLGNGKGAWSPTVIDDIAGTGGGDPGDITTQIANRKAGYGLGGPRLVDKEMTSPSSLGRRRSMTSANKLFRKTIPKPSACRPASRA